MSLSLFQYAEHQVRSGTAENAINACRIVTLSGADLQVDQCASNEQPFGIAPESAAAGATVTVITGPGNGVLDVDAASAISVGSLLKATTGGVGVVASANGDWVIGRAEQALASGTGRIRVTFWTPFRYVVPA